MWEIRETAKARRQLRRLPQRVLQRYDVWLNIVEVSGPEGLLRIPGFRDEALRGEWKGHRSSRLTDQYRVIYRVEREQLVVEVVRVTPHDYGK